MRARQRTSIAVLGLFIVGALADGKPDTPPVKKLRTGFRFVEGPAFDGAGNLYFSDIPNARIHKLTPDGKLTVFREKSGRANGLFLHRGRGELYACEGGTGVVAAYSLDGKKRRVVAASYKGKRFNAPNDLVIDRAGGVYFTDPKFGRDRKSLPQGVWAVYYRASGTDGDVSRVADDFKLPNGIMLSPDEKTLYVVQSGSEIVWAFPVEKPGTLGKRREFCRLKQPQGQTGRGGDGLTVDKEGTLYITTRLGLQVFSAKGKARGVIAIPETPANVTFGGKDGRTLYVTARTSVYAVRAKVRGHRFRAGKPAR